MLQRYLFTKESLSKHSSHFGTRTVRDVLYYDELMQYTYAIEGFRYDIALSRDSSPVVGSHFHAGYVHPIYLGKNMHQRMNRFIFIYVDGQ